MCEEVEHTCHIAYTMMYFRTGNAERYHHESYLRDCRERKHTLDVDLCTSDHGCIEGSKGANNDYYVEGGCFHEVEGEQTRYQIYTCHNHSSGVDKRADGVGPSIASGSQM